MKINLPNHINANKYATRKCIKTHPQKIAQNRLFKGKKSFFKMESLPVMICMVLILFATKNGYCQSYYLVVSSHSTMSIALQEADKLKASGFVNASVSPQTNNSFRVYLNEYPSKKMAQADAKKYARKFSDAWILEAPSSGNTEQNSLDIIRNNMETYRKEIRKAEQEMDSLKLVLENMQQKSNMSGFSDELFNDLQKKLSEIGQKINTVDAKFETNENTLNDLRKNIANINYEYLKKEDTIQYAMESIHGNFDFGKPKLIFDLALFRSEVISNFSPELLNYFDISNQSVSTSFFGLNLACFYNITPKLATGIDLHGYYYSNTFYLFPSIGIKLSKQLGTSPIKLIPSFNIGTDVLLLKDQSIRTNGYWILTPGMEVEIGLNKRISLISATNFNYSISNKNNGLNQDIQHFNHKIGLRFNLFQH